MSSFANMPAFFGRATAVLGEHAALHSTLARLRPFCSVGRALAERPALVVVLGEFVSQLEAHFAAEEHEGYFGTVLGAFPSSRPSIEKLCVEHAAFLVLARSLLARARELAAQEEFALTLSALLDDLASHERAESSLLKRYFAEAEL